MSHPIDRVLDALKKANCRPKISGNGWSCKCPAHDDHSPSLSVAEGSNGTVLVHCHRGCTAEAIVKALGLHVRDLMPAEPSEKKARRAGAKKKVAAPDDANAAVFPTAREAVSALERSLGKRAGQWVYRDARGVEVGVVVRWDLPSGKTFRPVSKHADGWRIEGMPEPRPLYRLPELLAIPTDEQVWIAEGEACADALVAMGFHATTSVGGAKGAALSDWSALKGRSVVILPDRDKPGTDYARDVAAKARAAGASSIRVIRLEEIWNGLPAGGDIVDFLAHLGGDTTSARAQLEAAAEAAEEVVSVSSVVSEPSSPADAAWVPFPVHLLPEPVSSFVAEGAKAIGCDPSFIALPLLSALAAAIGNTCHIELKRGWTEPPILWVAIVGESGSMKTPAFKLALKAFRRMQANEMKTYEAAMEEWRADHLRYEKALAAWKRDHDGGGDDPPEEPQAPIAVRRIVSDTTVEALAPILKDNPRGVLLARDEIGGWIASFDRYARTGKVSGDLPHWLSMHNGEEMLVDRKTGPERTMRVPSASVSICGGIQPGILAMALNREHQDSGLVARLLFAMPPRARKKWTEADIDPASEEKLVSIFNVLRALAPDKDENRDPKPRIIRFTPTAKGAWIEFYNVHGGEQAELTGDLAATWSKLEGYAARLSLVIHLLRWAGQEGNAVQFDRIDEQIVAAGVALARWFGEEARRVHAVLGETPEDRDRRRLVEAIKRLGGSATARELMRCGPCYRTAADAEAALQALVDDKIGKWETSTPGSKGGRPTERFVLYESTDSDTTSADPDDPGGSVSVSGPEAPDTGGGE